MLKITGFMFVAASFVVNAQMLQPSAFEKQAEINAQQSQLQQSKSTDTSMVYGSSAEKIIVGKEGVTTTVKPPQNAPVVIFQGRGPVQATIDDTKQTGSSSAAVQRTTVQPSATQQVLVVGPKQPLTTTVSPPLK